jgi:putative Holliday junction resolvase
VRPTKIGVMSRVWLGVDVGTVRVGVAKSDLGGSLASPLTTLARRPGSQRDLQELARLVAEHDAVGVVLGLPRTLAGREGPSAEMARAYGNELAVRIAPIPVEFVDERLTTVIAERRLSAHGVRGRAKRAVVDQVAAVVILQQWLDADSGR